MEYPITTDWRMAKPSLAMNTVLSSFCVTTASLATRRVSALFISKAGSLGEAKPVIIIAQSLGCEQISNYIWDAMNGKRLFQRPGPGTPEKRNFRKLSTCRKFITTGCNIPIFRAGLNLPILFPRPNENFDWQNYFDADDVLAYPIRNMSDSYNIDWISDNKVSVGGFLTGWNPACHRKYWTDKDVVKPIAAEIKSILDS